VLVHCQAGISRSATICIAYVMKLYGIGLEEAFDFVRARRSHISPHLNFMHQLQQYELQLQQLAPSKIVSTPSLCLSEQRFKAKVRRSSKSGEN
jgi:protein-tyrosine phosphatase